MLSLTLPVVIAAASLVSTPSPSPRPTFAQQDMSFFITSVGSGDGANLGGLAGADKH
ncbi:MAG: lectin, partial [Gemmatimonas sp.]